MLSNTLHLSKKNLFNLGNHRHCYIHPDNQDICIKVDHYEFKKKHKETRRERGYFWRLRFIKPKLNYDYIAKYYGSVSTNFGKGLLCELVRDETTGEISKTLLDTPKELIKQRYSEIVKEIETVKSSLFQNGVLIRDFHPGNIVVKHLSNNKLRMVIIDGIGHTNFIPVVEVFNWLARKKLQRIFKKKTSQGVDDFLKGALE